jgi:hypothetical protein
MSFQPVIPIAGVAGWSFLTRTLERQQQAFDASAIEQRDTAYFREKIGTIETAEQLVSDRRLLKVALGAFGLQDDLNNRYFIRKVLEEGTGESDSLANRLADKRYRAFATAFGFGEGETLRTTQKGFADEILPKYRTQSFEVAVGSVNTNMRLALGLERELQNVLGSTTGADARWFSVMGQASVRKVFEAAFGLPATLAVVDLDLQLATFKKKAEAYFGTSDLAEMAKPENLERLRELFLARSDSTRAISDPAVVLLSRGGSSAAGILSVLYG